MQKVNRNFNQYKRFVSPTTFTDLRSEPKRKRAYFTFTVEIELKATTSISGMNV